MLQGRRFVITFSVKVVVLNEFCDLSELMAVRETSKYPCIPFRSITVRTNMPRSIELGPEALVLGVRQKPTRVE